MLKIKELLTKILQKLNTLDNKVGYQVILPNTDYKGTKSNQWEDTGLTFTVPSGYIYLTQISGGWNSGKPLGLGIDIRTGAGTPSFAIQGDYVSRVFFTLGQGTYRIYTYRATVPTAVNTYSVLALKYKV